jgi:hypothetical protein
MFPGLAPEYWILMQNATTQWPIQSQNLPSARSGAG